MLIWKKIRLDVTGVVWGYLVSNPAPHKDNKTRQKIVSGYMHMLFIVKGE